METLFANLRNFDQTTISYLQSWRAELTSALEARISLKDKIRLLGSVLTSSEDDQLQRYGRVILQTVGYDEIDADVLKLIQTAIAQPF